jgi:prevent-host-death family protein
MKTTRITSRQFNQDVSGAKRAAEGGPVIITDRGEPKYVLMRHDQYRRLQGKGKTLVDLLGQPKGRDIEFEPPRLADGLFHPATLE